MTKSTASSRELNSSAYNHPNVNYALFTVWWEKNQDKYPTYQLARHRFTELALAELAMEREIEGR